MYLRVRVHFDYVYTICQTHPFQAENCIYRVHTHFLMRDSLYFRETLSSLLQIPQRGKGLRADDPLLLTAPSAEVDSLLEFYYHGQVNTVNLKFVLFGLN